MSRITPFRKGYIDGLKTNTYFSHLYEGRRRVDYQNGYTCGIYASVQRWMRSREWSEVLTDYLSNQRKQLMCDKVKSIDDITHICLLPDYEGDCKYSEG